MRAICAQVLTLSGRLGGVSLWVFVVMMHIRDSTIILMDELFHDVLLAMAV